MSSPARARSPYCVPGTARCLISYFSKNGISTELHRGVGNLSVVVVVVVVFILLA